MNDLDKKLEEAFEIAGIYSGALVPTSQQLKDRLRPLIKQAFVDAGWLEPSDPITKMLKEPQSNAYESMLKLSQTINENTEDTPKGYYMPQALYDVLKDTFEQSEVHKASELMTGQDWYEKFEKQLSGIALPYHKQPHDAQMAFNLCKEAAKKAIGLE